MARGNTSSKPKKVKGVGGWLFLLVFTLLVAPFVSILFFGIDYLDLGLYDEFLEVMVFAIWSCYLGILAISDNDNVVSYIKEYFIIILGINLLGLIMGTSDYIGSLFMPTVWLVYLNESTRVKNTYKNHDINYGRLIGIFLLLLLSGLLGFGEMITIIIILLIIWVPIWSVYRLIRNIYEVYFKK